MCSAHISFCFSFHRLLACSCDNVKIVFANYIGPRQKARINDVLNREDFHAFESEYSRVFPAVYPSSDCITVIIVITILIITRCHHNPHHDCQETIIERRESLWQSGDGG
jgi:hypothetical protein